MNVYGLNYEYNRNGRIPISNPLVWFLYDEVSIDSRKSIPMYDDKCYDLSHLLKDIRIQYNKSYWHGFPRYIKIDINRANNIFKKKRLPFIIEEINNNDELIEKRYRLRYIGEFANEITCSTHYDAISRLDQIYVMFDLACKYSPISERNMKKLIKDIYEIADDNYMIRCRGWFKFNINNIKSINNTLKTIKFPFVIQFMKDIKGRSLYLFKKIDNESINH